MAFSRLCVFCLSITLATTLHASDLDSLVADCNDCHGKQGISTDSDVPTIAGQAYIVLEENMMAYADEERPCPVSKYRHGDMERPSTTMCELAASLSEDDITVLSKHYEGLAFVAASQPFDQVLADEGAEIHDRHCEKCHSEGGSLAEDEAGILAGQWMPYMQTSMKEILAGERAMPEKMKQKTDRLNDDDVEALLHFYASQQD